MLSVLPNEKEERSFIGHLRRLIPICQSTGLDQYLSLISRFPQELKNSLYGDRLLNACSSANSIDTLQQLQLSPHPIANINDILEIDLQSYLADDILVKVDRASMGHGLEVRNPFLDIDIVRLALSFPFSWKQKGQRRKRILVDSYRDRLPLEIFNRRKMGFGVPIAKWLRAEWKQPVADLLLNGNLTQNNYFRRDRLEALLNYHNANRSDFSYAIFALVILEIHFTSQTKPNLMATS